MLKRMTLAATMLLSGCIGMVEYRPQTPASPTPVCSNVLQCEVMWAKATETVSAVSGMALRLASDQVLETFAPVGPTYYPRMHGRVLKTPVGQETYEFRASFRCGEYCRDHEIAALGRFNQRVNAAGAPYATARN